MNFALRTTRFAVFVICISFFSRFVAPLSAQAPMELSCGESVESMFTTDRQVHNYVVSAGAGMALIINAEIRIGNYEDLSIDLGLWAPNGFEIEELQSDTGFSNSPSATDTISTDWLSVEGQYSLKVVGRTNTGGAYYLTISCRYEDGNVVSSTHLVQPLQCGSIVENIFYRDEEIHRYYIVMNKGDQLSIEATSLAGSYESLILDLGLWAPNDFEIEELQSDTGFSNSPLPTQNISTGELSVTGVYRLLSVGRTSTSGNYELTVTCRLANGTVINPGDTPPVLLVSSDTSIATPDVTFSGFGFPGLAPVDFTSVARLPIPAGIPMSGAVTPTGSEILGYQFDAEAGDTVELSFNRLSGNLNLGLVVIDSESNVIYQASLVTTQSMTARFTVPTAGQYTAGIFRISLLPPSAPESTAFQVIATVNP